MLTIYKAQHGSPSARLTLAIGAADTEIYVDDGSILPEAPMPLTVGLGSDCEVVLCVEKDGNRLVVDRGFHGTVPAVWAVGTEIYRAFTAYDQDALAANMQELMAAQEANKQELMDALEVGTIVCELSGLIHVINDAADCALRGLTVYGNSVQLGKPSPDAPYEISSVFDAGGGVSVSFSGGTDFMPVSHVLRGVQSGAENTSYPMKLHRDEIDFARGVLLKRVTSAVLSSDMNWKVQTNTSWKLDQCVTCYASLAEEGRGDSYYPAVLCNIAAASGWYWTKPDVGKNNIIVRGNTVYLSISYEFLTGCDASSSTEEKRAAFIRFLGEMEENGGVEVVYALASPVEIPLTEEEIAAYRSLRTYSTACAVRADDSAETMIRYVANTKTYIDKKFEAIAAAMVANV